MSYSIDRSGHLLLAMLLALPVAACEQGPTDTLSPDGLRADFVDANDVRVGDGQVEQEQVEVCKSGMDATFLVEVVNRSGSGTANLSYDVDVGDGECYIVWESGGPYVDDVTITEYVPAGYEASWVMDQLDGGVTTQTAGVGNQVVTYIAGVTGISPTNAGAIVWFTNTPIEVPGGEGCTPGYWKQEHHFDDWVGYLPTDLFTTPGFEDAFPGMTLLQVASQGGGGINALGRHAVAALLNATSSVAYAYTEAQVVQMFNDAYNGITDIGDTKDAFEVENEYGAPLCGYDVID